jgi:hypothetical protein
MPKFTFKTVELNNNIFYTGNDNFGGKYTPLSRRFTNATNDSLHGGGNNATISSGYSLDSTDISKTTEAREYVVNAGQEKPIYAPNWARGITVQGHGGGGGGGGGGGNSRAWWAGDAWSYGGQGGSGGSGGYGYLRKSVNAGQYVEIKVGTGGAGGGGGSNSSSPNNNADGNDGGHGANGNSSNVYVGNWYTVGVGGNKGFTGSGGNKVYDNQAGEKERGGNGAPGNSGAGPNGDWNNVALAPLHNTVGGGNHSNEWYGSAHDGAKGKDGKVIYKWNTSAHTTYHST